MSTISLARRRGLAVATLGLTAALTLVGCTQTTNGSGGGSTPDGGTTPEAGACGSVPSVAPTDPDGLLDGLSPDLQDQYNLYPYEIKESAWSDWKSERTEGYTAAIVGQAPAAPFIATYLETLADSLTAAGVEIVLNTAPNDPTDVPGQLQQFGQALSLQPDIIIYMAAAPEPSIDLVEQAHDAGIPVVAAVVPIDSEYAINLAMNQQLQGAAGAAGVLDAIGGTGSVLLVNGVPGIPNQIWWEDGTAEALALCPDVTVAGEVEAFFQPPVAQQAVTQFLATNPAGVDAVLQAGTMGWAIRDAFQQSGLPVPPIADIGGSRGFAAWALDEGDYPYVGTATPAVPQAQAAAQIALKVLEGAGPKINQIVWNPYLVNTSNLADVVDPSWSPDDPTDLDPEGIYLTDEQLAEFFNNPELGPQSSD